MRAIAVFHDAGRGWAVTLFCGHRPGFRHCFAVLETEAGWIRVDALAHCTRIEAVAARGFDLADFYREQGLTAVELELGPPRRRELPPSWFSCVESAKRLLGIRAWWVWTPWQLYRHLTRQEGALLL